MFEAFETALRRRLSQPLPGLDAQLRMAPRPRLTWDPAQDPPLRDAAALVLLYPHEDMWWLPLTVRAATLPHHTGQVSLPGGRVHAGETLEETALRETHEEVGLAPGDVRVLGRLTPLPIPVSGHLLHPVVGMTATRPSFQPSAAEVARLLEASLPHLRAPSTVGWEARRRERASGDTFDVPYFAVEDTRVWGATAMVLAEFLAIVEELAAIED